MVNTTDFRRLKRQTALALVLSLSAALFQLPAQAQDDTLTAHVDRQEISIEETLTLRVRYTGQVSNDQPDFSLLEENFEIISQQQGNQVTMINGAVNSFTQWTLTLVPKSTGKLLIPSFKFDGHFSDAITITVTDARAAPGELKDIFIETKIDKSRVHVQEQVQLVYRLYTTRSIDSMDAEPVEIENVRIEELPQTRFQRRIDGTVYGVLEVRYALFPQTSTDFTIPAIGWTLRAESPNTRRRHGFGFGSNYELKRLRTEEKTVEVAPRPASFPADQPWLPAENLTLTQEWSTPPADLRVGEPVTWTITLRADGLTAAQLPPLPIASDPQGYKLYPDQPDLQNRTTQDGVTGLRTETIAVVPGKAGEVTIPAVKLVWWDTTADRLRTAELPEQTFHVTADGGTVNEPEQDPGIEIQGLNADKQQRDSADVGDAQDEQQSSGAWLWQLLAALFAILWLTFAALWWRQYRTPQAQPTQAAPAAMSGSEKQAFRALKKAGQNENPPQLRLMLLRWGNCRWPGRRLQSLQDLAHVINDPQITEELSALEAALYGKGGSNFDPARLVTLIDQWHQQKPAGSAKAQTLKPLYNS